jgi:hypothetical protein
VGSQKFILALIESVGDLSRDMILRDKKSIKTVMGSYQRWEVLVDLELFPRN